MSKSTYVLENMFLCIIECIVSLERRGVVSIASWIVDLVTIVLENTVPSDDTTSLFISLFLTQMFFISFSLSLQLHSMEIPLQRPARKCRLLNLVLRKLRQSDSEPEIHSMFVFQKEKSKCWPQTVVSKHYQPVFYPKKEVFNPNSHGMKYKLDQFKECSFPPLCI